MRAFSCVTPFACTFEDVPDSALVWKAELGSVKMVAVGLSGKEDRYPRQLSLGFNEYVQATPLGKSDVTDDEVDVQWTRIRLSRDGFNDAAGLCTIGRGGDAMSGASQRESERL